MTVAALSCAQVLAATGNFAALVNFVTRTRDLQNSWRLPCGDTFLKQNSCASTLTELRTHHSVILVIFMAHHIWHTTNHLPLPCLFMIHQQYLSVWTHPHPSQTYATHLVWYGRHFSHAPRANQETTTPLSAPTVNVPSSAPCTPVTICSQSNTEAHPAMRSFDHRYRLRLPCLPFHSGPSSSSPRVPQVPAGEACFFGSLREERLVVLSAATITQPE